MAEIGGPRILQRFGPFVGFRARALFGWHYLSNATCPIRPHLFYALFIVARITIFMLDYSPLLKKTCFRQVVLDKWFPLIYGRFSAFEHSLWQTASRPRSFQACHARPPRPCLCCARARGHGHGIQIVREGGSAPKGGSAHYDIC